MRAIRKTMAACAMAAAVASGAAQAALVDRGGGMLYDDVLDITWLQDANYAKTSGYDADGRMNWNAATTWAANLTFGGFDDWRLAATTDTGTLGCNWSYGGTDCGYNSVGSELAHMYFNNLGLKAYYSPTGTFQPNWGLFGNGTNSGPNDVGLVDNLQPYLYWSGTAFARNASYAWIFNANVGNQSASIQGNELFAWAVRPGDVLVESFSAASVPEPSSVMLLGLALAGLGAVRRRSFGVR